MNNSGYSEYLNFPHWLDTSVEPPCVTIENNYHVIKEWTSIHVFCRTAELAFIKPSTSSREDPIRIYQEHHKNTIFTILIIYLLLLLFINKPADLI